MSIGRRTLLALIGTVFGVLMPSGTAHADAPGPTDYRSEITSIRSADGQPLPEVFEVTVEGHDSFLLLTIDRGSTAAVAGYEGEPYLRFDADGSVYENRLSFSTVYNRDRYGSVERPDYIDHSAAPEWILVDDDGSFAWHDHRIHYMDPRPPIGAEPGDIIIDTSVPITVDGVTFDITVASTLLASPWPLPALVISVMAAAGVAVVIFRTASTRRTAGATAATAMLALVTGVGWYVSLPGDADPSITWILLPATGLVAALMAVRAALGQRSFTASAASSVALVQLALWAAGRHGIYNAALLPTALPQWIDRLVSAVVIGALLPLFSRVAIDLVRPAPAR